MAPAIVKVASLMPVRAYEYERLEYREWLYADIEFQMLINQRVLLDAALRAIGYDPGEVLFDGGANG